MLVQKENEREWRLFCYKIKQFFFDKKSLPNNIAKCAFQLSVQSLKYKYVIVV